jgi:hypothetical protein
MFVLNDNAANMRKTFRLAFSETLEYNDGSEEDDDSKFRHGSITFRPITITLQLYNLFLITITITPNNYCSIKITKSTITNTITITLALYY